MQSRFFSVEKDYATICEWWKAWGWQPVPEVFLPEVGIIVSRQGFDTCAGFLYQTDSAGCWIENIVTNKDAPKNIRRGTTVFLIDALAAKAKELNYLMAFSSSINKALINNLRKCGFSGDVKDVTQLVRLL